MHISPQPPRPLRFHSSCVQFVPDSREKLAELASKMTGVNEKNIEGWELRYMTLRLDSPEDPGHLQPPPSERSNNPKVGLRSCTTR